MTRNVKVIHCVGSLRYGGIERLVCDLIDYQNEISFITPALGVNYGMLKGELSQEFENLKTVMYDFKLTSGLDVNPIKIFNAWKILRSFDIIHLHGFNPTIVLASLFALRKVVYTEHGNFGNGREKKRLDFLLYALRKFFFRYTRVIIACNSKYTADVVRERFYNGSRLVVIYNGIRTERVIDDKLFNSLKKKYSNFYVIGTSSRLAGFKRIDRLILAFKKYISSNEYSRLVIVGNGPELCFLKSLVSKYEIEDKVIFEGYQREIATYQSCFDVCVFPSEGEPFGLVTIESYSLAKPVLVFNDSGGMAEVVSRISPEDVCSGIPSIVSRLEYYRQFPFELDDYRKSALSYFSISRMGQEYSDLYLN